MRLAKGRLTNRIGTAGAAAVRRGDNPELAHARSQCVRIDGESPRGTALAFETAARELQRSGNVFGHGDVEGTKRVRSIVGARSAASKFSRTHIQLSHACTKRVR